MNTARYPTNPKPPTIPKVGTIRAIHEVTFAQPYRAAGLVRVYVENGCGFLIEIHRVTHAGQVEFVRTKSVGRCPGSGETILTEAV